MNPSSGTYVLDTHALLYWLLETLDASEHSDPFDRIILGTAKAYKMPIITRDRWMKQQYKNTIW